MYGYKLKRPKDVPIAVWACKTSVDRYDWENNNDSNMIEFSICKAPHCAVKIGSQPPVSVSGKGFFCILGDHDVKSYAEDGVNVEIVSVAVRFDNIVYTAEELNEKHLREKDVLLLPLMLSDLPMQDWVVLKNVLYRFVSESVKHTLASDMICASLIFDLLALLDRLVRNQLREKQEKYDNYYVLKADSILEQGYSEKLTLRTVSNTLGITPNYLSFLYKKGKGICFSDRLCEIRMKKAEALVLDGKLSVSDIAEAVGFDDESHLRRRFKQYFGIGIKEYRLVSQEQTLYHEKPQRKVQ